MKRRGTCSTNRHGSPWSLAVTTVFWLLRCRGRPAAEDAEEGRRSDLLEMTKAVVCKTGRRVSRSNSSRCPTPPSPARTSSSSTTGRFHFKVEAVEKPKPGHRYQGQVRARTGRIRRKGEKAVPCMKKEDLILEYEPSLREHRDERIYLVNNGRPERTPARRLRATTSCSTTGSNKGGTSTQSLRLHHHPHAPKVEPEGQRKKGRPEPEGQAGPKSRFEESQVHQGQALIISTSRWRRASRGLPGWVGVGLRRGRSRSILDRAGVVVGWCRARPPSGSVFSM